MCACGSMFTVFSTRHNIVPLPVGELDALDGLEAVPLSDQNLVPFKLVNSEDTVVARYSCLLPERVDVASKKPLLAAHNLIKQRCQMLLALFMNLWSRGQGVRCRIYGLGTGKGPPLEVLSCLNAVGHRSLLHTHPRDAFEYITPLSGSTSMQKGCWRRANVTHLLLK